MSTARPLRQQHNRPSRPSRNATHDRVVPERFKLSSAQKKQYSTVLELKPDWTDDEILDFCRKCDFNSTVIQDGLTNAFEDSRPHKELCAADWNTVDKKPRKKKEDEIVPGKVVEGKPSSASRKDRESRRETEDSSRKETLDKSKDSRPKPVGERRRNVAGKQTSTGKVAEKTGEQPESTTSTAEKKPRWKRTPKQPSQTQSELPAVAAPAGEATSAPVAESKPEIQSKRAEPEQRQPTNVQTRPLQQHSSSEAVTQKPTYAGLLKRVSAPAAAPAPVQPSAVGETPEPQTEEVVESSQPVEVTPEVRESAQDVEPVVVVEESESNFVEGSDSSKLTISNVNVPTGETVRAAIIEESDAYLPASKPSPTPPTPIGPTPRSKATTTVKSSSARSIWRVKESQPVQATPSTPTPPPSPAEVESTPAVQEQAVGEEVQDAQSSELSDRVLYEKAGQEIIKEISSKVVLDFEAQPEIVAEPSQPVYEFGFGVSASSSSAPSFAVSSESVVSAPAEVELNNQESSFVEEEPSATAEVEGYDGSLAEEQYFDEMLPMEIPFDMSGQPAAIPPAQYAGYPGVLPTSPYMVHAPGVPHPYFVMAYEPESNPAAMNHPGYYDPYAQRRVGRSQQRPVRQNSKQGNSTVPATSGQYRPNKINHQKPHRSDRRNDRSKNDIESSEHFNEPSSPVQGSSSQNKTRSSSTGVSSSKRQQGVISRGNYMQQGPHQVPPVAMYPYGYAVPYSPQYGPVPFRGYVYAPGSHYNYMYPSGHPANAASGFEDESNAQYVAPNPAPAPMMSANNAPLDSRIPSTHNISDNAARPNQAPYQQVHPSHFDASTPQWMHPEMIPDPALAAAEYSMMHMMNAPSGYVDYAPVNVNGVNNAGYYPAREYSGSPSSASGSYYRMSGFNHAGNGAVGTTSAPSGSVDQTHHPLSFQQHWNHPSQ